MPIPSSELIDRLKKSEGFRAEPYLCPAGKVTIGYGHNLEAHPDAIRRWDEAIAAEVSAGKLAGRSLLSALRQTGMRWSEDDAHGWLLGDVADVVMELNRRCSAYRALVSKGEDARAEVLIDMAFNMGVAGLLGFKNTLDFAACGEYDRAADNMLISKWARQVGRRAGELARIMRHGMPLCGSRWATEEPYGWRQQR